MFLFSLLHSCHFRDYRPDHMNHLPYIRITSMIDESTKGQGLRLDQIASLLCLLLLTWQLQIWVYLPGGPNMFAVSSKYGSMFLGGSQQACCAFCFVCLPTQVDTSFVGWLFEIKKNKISTMFYVCICYVLCVHMYVLPSICVYVCVVLTGWTQLTYFVNMLKQLLMFLLFLFVGTFWSLKT